ncbi:MAG: TonB family protein [Candidatus Solibacter usitatus]|nr:TonB family protein [Candidatus Solibacter usitatus]
MRFRSFAASFLLHATVFSLVVFGPPSRSAGEKQSVYAQVFAPREKKLFWYRFRDRLPEVSPSEHKGISEPPRGEAQNPQTIVAGPPATPKANQLIWTPAPKLKIEQNLEAPNLLAFEAPPAPAPNRAKPKLFVPPPPPKPEAPADAPLPADPGIQVARASLPVVPLPARLPPKPFRVPEAKVTQPARLTLPSAPELQSSARLDQDVSLGQPGKLPPKPFVAPSGKAGAITAAVALPAAPELQSGGAIDPAAPLSLPGKLPPKPFTPPSAGAATASAGTGTALPVEEAPALPSDATFSAAIVGFNPSTRLDPVIPDGGRAARLSASPKPSAGGANGGPVESARVLVPDLMIRGGGAPKDARPTLLARAIVPSTRETLVAAARGIAPAPVVRESPPRAAFIPDPRFEGRIVYQIGMQSANVTSYSGSWTVWFAERESGPASAREMRAPLPLRKVDPTYAVSAMDERVEGSVRLAAVIRKDGQVDSISLVKGVDFRLDRSAMVALSKWQFEPARLGGVPIDIDAIVEVPFRLAPLARK